MRKLTSVVLTTLFLSQPLFAAGGYSSGTSSASTNASKDPFAKVYQLIEAKSVGADCILLIAAALSEKRCKELASFAKKLGLDVLLEVHNKEEIDSHLIEAVDIVGVNNRNLHDFTTNIDTSIALAQYIPDKFVKISESGITQAEHIVKLKKHGFKGFLIGTHFMSHTQPNQACAKLISEVKRLERL